MDAGEERGGYDPDMRLKGEILGALSDWQDQYGLVRLDLAWTVAQMLLQHIGRNQPLDAYLEFTERLAAILNDEAAQLRQVIAEIADAGPTDRAGCYPGGRQAARKGVEPGMWSRRSMFKRLPRRRRKFS